MENSAETTIWRYIDLGKFISLLATESLYFACPSEFDDPYEGLLPRSHVEAESMMVQPIIDQMIFLRSQMPSQSANSDLLNSFDNALSNLVSSVPRLHKEVSLKFGVSCWHKSEYESEAMWKLYSTSGYGIAIESTIGQLQTSLNNTKGVIIDSVRYMDFNKDPIEKGHKHYGLFIKRKSFEHEKEFRATIPLPHDGKGIFVKCDLGILITSIHLSPYAPVYLKDVVKSICSGNIRTLQKHIIPSKLLDNPDYEMEVKIEKNNVIQW
jgi:hypothetical protein